MKKGIATIFAVTITVIVMLLIFVGGWYLINQKWSSDKTQLKNQIKNLERELAELQNQNKQIDGNDNDEVREEAEGLSDFVTYASEEYGYSFQYPKSFSLVDWFWDGQNSVRVPQNGQTVWVSKTALSERAIPMDAGPVSQYFAISVEYDATTGLSALRGDGTGVVITDVTVGGVRGWKVLRTEVEEYSGNYTTAYYINHNNNVYSIQIVNSDASGTHDEEIDAMVESFSFE